MGVIAGPWRAAAAELAAVTRGRSPIRALTSAHPEVKEQAGEARRLRGVRRAEVTALAEYVCLGLGSDLDQPPVRINVSTLTSWTDYLSSGVVGSTPSTPASAPRRALDHAASLHLPAAR